MAASFARLNFRSMNGRAIIIHVRPTPITFAERRSVLQVLEQEGHLEFFRRTTGSGGTFRGITKDAATATRLIAQSPFHYDISAPRNIANITVVDLKNPRKGSGGTAAAAAPAASRIAPQTNTTHGSSVETSAEPDEKRQFQVRVFPNEDYDHLHSSISRTVLSGKWSPVWKKDRSFMAATLQQSLPDNLAARGLSHWLFESGDAEQTGWLHRVHMKQWRPSFLAYTKDKQQT